MRLAAALPRQCHVYTSYEDFGKWWPFFSEEIDFEIFNDYIYQF